MGVSQHFRLAIVHRADEPSAELEVVHGEKSNTLLRRAGTFWQEDYFDTYMRSEAHFRQAVRYIEDNPTKARLVRAPEDWLWSSARYRSKTGPVAPEFNLSKRQTVGAPLRIRSADGSSASHE
jgi:hypothetical protein